MVIAWFTHRRGVNITGDEPSYIIQAQAYRHLSPYILSTVKADLAAHSLAAYPAGAPINAVASFIGPHGIISPFEPGLGMLLIPFVAIGRLALGATLGVLLFNSAGLIYLHRRISRLARLTGPAQMVLGLMFVAPAVLLAATQIYPDFPSGVLIGCAVVELASIELTGTTTRLGLVVIAISMAYLPWLQIKNFVPAIVLLFLFVLVWLRARHGWKGAVVISALCLLTWGLLLAYNLRYFGHLLGLPEQAPSLGRSGFEYVLGLLFDRDQGLFVQVPIAILGLLGLWMGRKQLPISVIATVLCVGSILVLNGTYTSNPYGGFSLAGRFMWTAIPILAGSTGILLARWQEVDRNLRWPMISILALWTYQGVAILDGAHTYYNAFSPTPSWDPASWPGWWPGFNRLLPQFNLPGRTAGAPAVALVVALVLAGSLVIVAVQYTRGWRSTPGWLGSFGAIAIFVVVALAVVKPLASVSTLSFDAMEVGTPVVGTGHSAASPVVDLQEVVPDEYFLRLTYRLRGPAASGSMILSCVAPTSEQRLTVPLTPGSRTTSTSIKCRDAGFIATQFTVASRSELVVNSLQLRRSTVSAV